MKFHGMDIKLYIKKHQTKVLSDQHPTPGVQGDFAITGEGQ